MRIRSPDPQERELHAELTRASELALDLNAENAKLRAALRDMMRWVAAFAKGSGDHKVVMSSPRMENARKALTPETL